MELGCGNKRLDGYNIYLDAHDHGFNDVCNFEVEKLPIPDDAASYIHCNHVLEHIHDVQHILNECWRILKPGGIFEIKVPYGLWPGASKPVHFQCITACWFDWLRREDIYKWYGYRSWKILKLEEIKNNNTGEIYEVFCRMTPRK